MMEGAMADKEKPAKGGDTKLPPEAPGSKDPVEGKDEEGATGGKGGR